MVLSLDFPVGPFQSGAVIHPTATIHPKAKVDSSVQIGPYVVLDEGVEVGPRTRIDPHVYITGLTQIGSGNHFFAGCVIGEAPQDLKYAGEPTRLRIGQDNVFREHVTVHRSNKVDGETVIGSRNFLMQHSHVAHDSKIGDHMVLAGGALLAGHAEVGDRAFISGNCLIHQFVRIGALSMMRGGAAVSKDVPPFTMALGVNSICGLNTVGLRRAGIDAAERLELKQLYRLLFREGRLLRDAIAEGRGRFRGACAIALLDFVAGCRRGVCADHTNQGEQKVDEDLSEG